MFCMFCGRNIPEGSAYCRYCGKKQVYDETVSAPPATAPTDAAPAVPTAPTAQPAPSTETTPVTEPTPWASTTPTVAAPVVPPVAPVAAPVYHGDNLILRNFSKAQSDSYERLNADFGLTLDEGKFHRLHSLFRDTLRRDPTAGEIRILDTLDRAENRTVTRKAVGELYTDSPMIAETWADMMAKHAALHGVRGAVRSDVINVVPPCTYEDALSLGARYLSRTGVCTPITDGGKNAQGRTIVLSSLRQEAEALAAGYTPIFRAHADGEPRSVWIRRGASLPVTAERAGDVILFLGHVPPQAMAAFVTGEMQKTRPAPGAICALAGKSVLDGVLSICTAADIFPHHLTSVDYSVPGGRIEADALCTCSPCSPDGFSDYVLRVPLKSMQEISESLKKHSIQSVVLGHVCKGDKTIVRMRNHSDNQDVVAATLPSALLREYHAAGLHRHRAEVLPDVSPDSLGIRAAAVLPMFSPYSAEAGLTPDRCETVALTRAKGQIIPVPEAHLLLSTFSVTVTKEGVGYLAAGEALATAVESLTKEGISPKSVRLAVSVTVKDGTYAPGNLSVEVLCGLYRYAASTCIPAEDPVMNFIPMVDGDAPSVTVTVTAWARDNALCEKLTAETGDSPKSAASADAPAFTFPVLHRSYEPSLRALAHLLVSHQSATISLRPVAMRTMEKEVRIPDAELPLAVGVQTEADEPIPDIPRTRKEFFNVPDPDSVSRLAEQLTTNATPVFAMNTEDTRMLLSEPTIVSALEERLKIGYPIIALNGACAAFAEVGLLPSALKKTATIPTVGKEITSACSSTQITTTRIPQADLQSFAIGVDSSALVTLTLADGTAISDGFTGGGGKVLGLLNGVDHASLPLLFAHTFENN